MNTTGILLVGATSAIGRVLVRNACAYGNISLLLASRSSDSSLAALESDRVRYLSEIDCTDEAAVRNLASVAEQHFTGPFAIVHSVGNFWVHKRLIDTSASEIREMFESHYLTLALLARALVPVIQRKGGGHLVTFSCNSVGYSYPDMSPFTAAKAAVESLIKCLANEYADIGLSATAVALPTIRTPRVVEEKPTGDHSNYPTPEDVAVVVLETILNAPPIVNGNVIKLFRHSPSFFGKGYFERNPRSLPDD